MCADEQPALQGCCVFPVGAWWLREVIISLIQKNFATDLPVVARRTADPVGNPIGTPKQNRNDVSGRRVEDQSPQEAVEAASDVDSSYNSATNSPPNIHTNSNLSTSPGKQP